MSLNIATVYDGEFFVIENGRVGFEFTRQYGELLDLWQRYYEENVVPVEEAGETLRIAYELEKIRPYLGTFGLQVTYSLDEKVILLRYPKPVEVCPDIWTDAMSYELNCSGGEAVASEISRWLFADKEEHQRGRIPFGETIFPVLYNLVNAA